MIRIDDHIGSDIQKLRGMFERVMVLSTSDAGTAIEEFSNWAEETLRGIKNGQFEEVVDDEDPKILIIEDLHRELVKAVRIEVGAGTEDDYQ